MFAKLDPVVNAVNFNDFDNIEPLKKVSDKIGQGCRPAHLVFIFGAIIILLMVFELGSYLIGSLVGFLYPAYMSFKALETQGQKDDKQWLTYWVVFSFFTVFDGVIASILYFLPAYNFFKMVFYIYLFYPQTRGAEHIYNALIEPQLTKYEAKIDELINKGQSQAKDAFAKAKQNIE